MKDKYEASVPRTHDLEELQRLCLEVCAVPELAVLDLTQITDYAVAARYDIEFWPEKAALIEALLMVEEVQNIVSSLVSPESA